MHWRTKLGALLGAGSLVLLAASAVVAAQTYTIDVTKTADPAAVPVTGGDVEYTVWVENTGSGFFKTVVVDDGMAGCTLGAPTGDDGDGKLESGETWAYTCTVTNVMPDTENTATVNACHDLSDCAGNHDATGTGSVRVTEGAATNPPGGTPNPTSVVGGATQPTTDADFGAATGGPGNNGLLLILALGVLLASIVVLTPAKAIRRR